MRKVRIDLRESAETSYEVQGSPGEKVGDEHILRTQGRLMSELLLRFTRIVALLGSVPALHLRDCVPIPRCSTDLFGAHPETFSSNAKPEHFRLGSFGSYKGSKFPGAGFSDPSDDYCF